MTVRIAVAWFCGQASEEEFNSVVSFSLRSSTLLNIKKTQKKDPKLPARDWELWPGTPC